MRTTFSILAVLGFVAGAINLPAGLAVMATSLVMAAGAND